MFANEIWKYNERQDDVVAQEIKKADFDKAPKTIKIRFVGIYDTVSSYNDSNFSSDTVYDDQTKNGLLLRLDKKLGYVAHLTAQNEYRQMFPLTNCASKTAGIELTLPGCHSDIGGGYMHNDNEEVVVEGPYTDCVKHDRDRLVEMGWYKPDQIKWTTGVSRVKGKRQGISNKYSHLILNLMVEIGARKYKIPWQEKKLASFPIIPELELIKKLLWEYAFEGVKLPLFYNAHDLKEQRKLNEHKRSKNQLTQAEIDQYNQKVKDHNMYKDFRNKFLHWSASMDGIGMEPLKDDKTGLMMENRHIIPG